MDIIQIVTKGNVSFPAKLETTAGYRYDIPFDHASLPTLPLSESIREQVTLPDGILIGRAHPAGYLGLIGFAGKMLDSIPNSERYIRSYYTEDRFDPGKGYSVRCLKPGNTFEAYVSFPEEATEEIRQILESITHIGCTEEGISGEVSVRLVRRTLRQDEITLSPFCHYTALHYTVMLLSSACFYEPYRSGSSTTPYIPGSAVRRAFTQSGLNCTPALHCSNAYIHARGERLLPMPLCASLVKLDKTQLRYRMAEGKDPGRIEQFVGMENTFTNNIADRLVHYIRPDIKQVISSDGTSADALESGQLFSGILYGSDASVRAVFNHLKNNPILNLGDMTHEGLGEAICRIDRITEEEIPVPILASRFDLCCVSDVLLISDSGMPAYHPHDLLEEAERLLGCSGGLRICSQYTGIRHDFSRSTEGLDRSVTRCLKMGSVLRLETIDGHPVNLSPLLHTFIGERTDEGYGEIIAYPARECYYRMADNTAPSLYTMNISQSPRDIAIGAQFVSTVMKNLLKARVELFAQIDRTEYEQGVSAEDLLPTDLLHEMRDLLYPDASDEEMREWYLKCLKEDEDESDSD